MYFTALPFFTIPLEAQHVDRGADLTWRCIANGVPQVSISENVKLIISMDIIRL